jgi:hypothetical protein
VRLVHMNFTTNRTRNIVCVRTFIPDTGKTYIPAF